MNNNFQVYIFGGMDQKMNYNNHIRVLKYKNKKWELEYPKIQGQKPCPRIEFGFCFYKPLNCIFISGGKA